MQEIIPKLIIGLNTPGNFEEVGKNKQDHTNSQDDG
jgi:hypothetical protein